MGFGWNHQCTKHIDNGGEPEKFALDLSAPTCKKVVDRLFGNCYGTNAQRFGSEDMDKTGLMRAWDEDDKFVTDALVQAHKLFPNLQDPEAPADGEQEGDPTEQEQEQEDVPTNSELEHQLQEQLTYYGEAWETVTAAVGGA